MPRPKLIWFLLVSKLTVKNPWFNGDHAHKPTRCRVPGRRHVTTHVGIQSATTPSTR